MKWTLDVGDSFIKKCKALKKLKGMDDDQLEIYLVEILEKLMVSEIFDEIGLDSLEIVPPEKKDKESDKEAEDDLDTNEITNKESHSLSFESEDVVDETPVPKIEQNSFLVLENTLSNEAEKEMIMSDSIDDDDLIAALIGDSGAAEPPTSPKKSSSARVSLYGSDEDLPIMSHGAIAGSGIERQKPKSKSKVKISNATTSN